MSIKSDVWIKRMSREQKLIDPFEEKLIRAVDDRRIISCGLSSYGYDCRLARDEFKVFSPVTGTDWLVLRSNRLICQIPSFSSLS